MLIFLIGQSGSGKSYWAKKLADSLNIGYLDMDELISDRCQQSVSTIFKEKGAAFFRAEEKKMLHKIIEQHGKETTIAVATGGGAPCHEDNMKVMLQTGTVIYLETPIALITQRLSNTSDRPLLAAKDGEELINMLQEQLNSRKEFYEQAHYKIDATKATTATFAAIIDPAKDQQ